MQRRIVLASKALALVIGLLLLARALSSTDWSASAARLSSVGPAALLVLLPFPLGMALDAAAWRSLLSRLGTRVPFARLFRARMATEAVTIAVPAGGILTEALGPILLADRAPIGKTFTTSAAKRWLIIRTHGYYVAIAALAGAAFLRASSRTLFGHEALPWLVGASALALVLVSVLTQAAATRLGIAARVHAALERLRGSRWLGRFAVAADRASFDEVDRDLVELGGQWHVGPSLSLLGTWMLESFETLIILRVLGADVSYGDVLALEAALSFVRSAAMFAPAGLGVQDVGYLAFFSVLGVPDAAAVGPAFLVMKRSKELVFVVVGFTLLFVARGAARAATSPSDADDVDADLDARAGGRVLEDGVDVDDPVIREA